jgi:hypothetical protein
VPQAGAGSFAPQAGAGSFAPQAGAGSFVPQAEETNSLAVIKAASKKLFAKLYI